ncbi:MAG: D-glycerate dehydrogenase [Rhodospirillales bacterium]|nr:D-glycerate dehydrogenase [Rhodospirillales bacterium]
MAKAKIVVTRRLPDAVMARASRDYDAHLNPTDEVYSPDKLVSLAAGRDGILLAASDRFDAALIERLPPSVRIAATFSVGYEHVDTAQAKKRGLVVTNTPDVLTDATADITFALLLSAARRLGEGERIVRAGKWTGWTPTQLLATEVTGKRLGIVGMGRIGRAVAKRARAFNMTMHYYNRQRLAPELEAGATFHPKVETLLPVSDFLSLHCPATAETRHLLNAARIALLPKGAIVVNAARGAVIDDNALIAALKSGHVAAAGLDVYDGEPKINPGYFGFENVVLAPHLGSATVETRNAMGFRALDNLDAFFAGREPKDRVA